MVLDDALSCEEGQAEWRRAWTEEFQSGRKGGSCHRFAFLAHHYQGQKRLEKLGLLELFRRTERLPDYQRAEDGVRRGWGRWMELEFGIGVDEARDKLKIRQFVLLYQLHRAKSRASRQRILRGYSVPCGASAARGDNGFFRKLGHALDDPPRAEDNTNDFAQVLLDGWLTRFWWLMPLKAVAQDMAGIQGEPDNGKLIARLHARLRQIKRRKAESGRGSFLSAGWSGCFYSANPPLIDCIEANGRPLFTAAGRRLLV